MRLNEIPKYLECEIQINETTNKDIILRIIILFGKHFASFNFYFIHSFDCIAFIKFVYRVDLLHLRLSNDGI